MINSPSPNFATEIEVIFRDLDAMGHVNNAVYFTYMETTRTRFFSQIMNLDEPLQLPIIIAEASCTFNSAAKFRDLLQVEMSVAKIGVKSFELHYKLSTRDNPVIATGRTVMVAYDYERNCPIEIPQNLRTLLTAYHAQPAT